MLNDSLYSYAECSYAEYCYTECCYAKSRGSLSFTKPHIGRFWVILGSFEIIVGSILGHLGAFGPFWAIFESFGPFWVILGHLGPFGAISGQFWGHLGPFLSLLEVSLKHKTCLTFLPLNLGNFQFRTLVHKNIFSILTLVRH
jgi:hypothetical protein